jgi:hypothetical protein
MTNEGEELQEGCKSGRGWRNEVKPFSSSEGGHDAGLKTLEQLHPQETEQNKTKQKGKTVSQCGGHIYRLSQAPLMLRHTSSRHPEGEEMCVQ